MGPHLPGEQIRDNWRNLTSPWTQKESFRRCLTPGLAVNTERIHEITNKPISLLKGRREDHQEGVASEEVSRKSGLLVSQQQKSRDASLGEGTRTAFPRIPRAGFDQHMEPRASWTDAILAAPSRGKRLC